MSRVRRGTIKINGEPVCPRCERRPRQRIPETAKAMRAQHRRYYGYCQICSRDAEWERRERNKLSADEIAVVMRMRKTAARRARRQPND